jgi:DNA replication licensing factor MCM4
VDQVSTVPIPASNGLDEIRAIWGTTVNLGDTMRSFREFRWGFKPKYRLAYNRQLGLRTQPLASLEQGEAILYFRRMRQTGETL